MDDESGSKDINRMGRGILNQQVEVDPIHAEDLDVTEEIDYSEVEAAGDTESAPQPPASKFPTAWSFPEDYQKQQQPIECCSRGQSEKEKEGV